MTSKAQKVTPNLSLKTAIVRSGRKQRRIAVSARIPEVHLSKIVTGRVVASAKERERLARVLQCSEHDLFPTTVEMVDSPVPDAADVVVPA